MYIIDTPPTGGVYSIGFPFLVSLVFLGSGKVYEWFALKLMLHIDG